jgi:5-methylcytosine-specific restriction endonuclease McrA
VYPKPRKRLKNPALLRAMREEIPYCERCGKPGYGGMHHIVHRSQRGDDVRTNLVRLCYECHTGVHDGRYDSQELVEIMTRREGIVCQMERWK